MANVHPLVKNNANPAFTTRRRKVHAFLPLIAAITAFTHVTADDFLEQRSEMLQEIEADVRETSLYIDKTHLDERVIHAMSIVPRHEFMPEKARAHAYENRPVPIGHGQTISQPYIVALMTDLLRVDDAHQVLEIGTGSGYQAAVLAELVNHVYTIEIVAELEEQAKKRLARLGYRNVTTRLGDGYFGWEEHAPFDAIIVTAASNHIPPSLIEQLKPGGRMVIPVGGRFHVQQLTLVEKDIDGRIRTRQMLPVVFVPLTGKH